MILYFNFWQVIGDFFKHVNTRLCLKFQNTNCHPHSKSCTSNITTQSIASPRTPHLSMIPIVTFTFELWPPKLIGFTMVNMCAKFNEEAQNDLVCIWFTAYFHTPLWPWPLTSKIKRSTLLPWLTKEIHNRLVSFVFTSLSRYMSIVTLTFDLQNR